MLRPPSPTIWESELMLNIPAGSFEVSFVHQQQATLRLAVCTVGMTYDGADFDTDAAFVEGYWIADVMGFGMSSSYHLTQVNWRSADGTIRSSSYDVAGPASGAAATPQVSYLIRKNTALAGRKNRGRLYLPGVMEVAVDSAGKVDSGYVTDITAAFTSFQTHCAAKSMTPVILHNSLESPTGITSWACETVCATQRRRLRK